MPGARATVDTPFGPFTTILDAAGVVVASGWTDRPDDDLLPLVHASLLPDEVLEVADLGDVTAAVHAFHDGDAGPAAAVPVRQHGGPLLQEIWSRMREIPAGSPVSYTELATRAGRPTAPRWAARACAGNAASLFVPCHRVRRVDGTLGGFRWGLETKEHLLAMESAQADARA